MRQIMALYTWLNVAVSGIRFGPDREAVRAELRAHFEDKAADLRRVFPGIPEQDAQELALSAMGDAWEVKQELARVHRPWLGYLWTASRAIVWAALALVLVLVLDSGLPSLGERWQKLQEVRTVGEALYEDGAPGWEGERLAVLHVEGKARLGRSVVSATHGARWREPEGDCLYIRLRITWDRPWEVNQMAINHLWVEDDLGNTYEIGTARSLPGWTAVQGLEAFTAQAQRREDGWFIFQFAPHVNHREGQSCAMEMLMWYGPWFTAEQMEQPYRLTLADAQGNVLAEQSGVFPPDQRLHIW